MKKKKFNKSGHTEVITNTEQSLSEVVLIRMVLCLFFFFFLSLLILNLRHRADGAI